VLNRNSDPSSPSIQVPMRIFPLASGRRTELTTSIRLSLNFRAAISESAAALDCGEPSS